jgi:hypothetical protein
LAPPTTRRLFFIDGNEGIDFVRCHICGDHRRVISGRHLSKHDIDRETYMEEYHLTPDELIAKAFRMIQSSHPGYHPYTKKSWIAAMQKVYERDGQIFAGYLQDNTRIYIGKEFGFSVIGIKLCARQDLIRRKRGCADSGTRKQSSKK